MTVRSKWQLWFGESRVGRSETVDLMTKSHRCWGWACSALFWSHWVQSQAMWTSQGERGARRALRTPCDTNQSDEHRNDKKSVRGCRADSPSARDWREEITSCNSLTPLSLSGPDVQHLQLQQTLIVTGVLSVHSSSLESKLGGEDVCEAVKQLSLSVSFHRWHDISTAAPFLHRLIKINSTLEHWTFCSFILCKSGRKLLLPMSGTNQENSALQYFTILTFHTIEQNFRCKLRKKTRKRTITMCMLLILSTPFTIVMTHYRDSDHSSDDRGDFCK